MNLFNWLRKQKAAWSRPPDERSRSAPLGGKFAPLGGEIDEAIESVAVLIDDNLAFRKKAKDVANRFGPDAIEALRLRFHRTTGAPPGFSSEERGLGGWLSAWQFALFEIVYQFREKALPLLQEIAFGKYDWTQGNAIEVLCRLAADGIEREQTIADLKDAFPHMRDTALLHAAAPMLQQTETNPALAGVMAELRQVPQFEMAVRELRTAGPG